MRIVTWRFPLSASLVVRASMRTIPRVVPLSPSATLSMSPPGPAYGLAAACASYCAESYIATPKEMFPDDGYQMSTHASFAPLV